MRVISTSAGTQVIVHLLVDVRDAMGANAVNSMAEALAPHTRPRQEGAQSCAFSATKQISVSCVHTEYSTVRCSEAVIVVDDIVLASAFAAADPYRAATHNKGIMNGITAVVLATGNDTRAIEAGCHAHAARNGQYAGIVDIRTHARR